MQRAAHREPEGRRAGRIGVSVLAAGTERALGLQPGQSTRGGVADPRSAPLPAHPARWLSRPPETVGSDALRAIDELGIPHIVTLQGQPGQCSAGCAEAFPGAVAAALAQRRCIPLQGLDWIDGPDQDGDGESDSVDRGLVEVRSFSRRRRFVLEQAGSALRVGMPPAGA